MTTTVLPERGPSATSGKLVLAAHILPFIVWLGLMFGLEKIGDPGAWKYAVRTLLSLALLLWLRPWRWYSPARLRNVPLAVGVGVLVFVVWVLPEFRFSSELPFWQEMYMRFGVFPPGQLVEKATNSIYAPGNSGWPLIVMRLIGSALVIAVIEEFFWRGFLYRWLVERNFLRLNLGQFDLEAFLVSTVLFGFEHNRWLVGIIAGMAYTWLMIRTRDIWAACLAHIVTNLILGVYVLSVGAYEFW